MDRCPRWAPTQLSSSATAPLPTSSATMHLMRTRDTRKRMAGPVSWALYISVPSQCFLCLGRSLSISRQAQCCIGEVLGNLNLCVMVRHHQGEKGTGCSPILLLLFPNCVTLDQPLISQSFSFPMCQKCIRAQAQPAWQGCFIDKWSHKQALGNVIYLTNLSSNYYD